MLYHAYIHVCVAGLFEIAGTKPLLHVPGLLYLVRMLP